MTESQDLFIDEFTTDTSQPLGIAQCDPKEYVTPNMFLKMKEEVETYVNGAGNFHTSDTFFSQLTSFFALLDPKWLVDNKDAFSNPNNPFMQLLQRENVRALANLQQYGYDQDLKDYFAIARQLFILNPVRYPHASEEVNDILIQHCNELIQKKDWTELLKCSTTLLYNNPGDVDILPHSGIDVEEFWPEILADLEKIKPDEDSSLGASVLECVQTLYPARIRQWQHFGEYIDYLKQHLTNENSPTLNLHYAYYLAVLTAGGLQVSMDGLEILPYNAPTTTTIAQIPTDFV